MTENGTPPPHPGEGPDRRREMDPAAERVAERLQGERPLPSPAFRGALGRYLAATDPGYGHRPFNLRATAAAYAAGGALLIALGALSAAGAL